MLENSDLKGVSEALGIPYSTFTKEMQRGDYVYIARENKYFKFIRDKNSLVNPKASNIKNEDFTVELTFIKENLEGIKRLLVNHSAEGQMLILDKEIYNTKAKFVNKNLKINEAIYNKFSKICESQFPQYKVQDITAQSLLDFINKYQDPNINHNS